MQTSFKSCKVFLDHGNTQFLKLSVKLDIAVHRNFKRPLIVR